MSQKMQEFKSHLNLIKAMTGDKAQEEFYLLMEKAKIQLGEMSLQMGQLYFEYAKFLLQKLQKNIDIFNAGALPVGQGVEEDAIAQDLYEDDSQIDNKSEVKSEDNVNADIDSEEKHEKEENEAIISENFPQETKQNQEKKQEQLMKPQQAQQNDDDYEVCADNLLCAIKIFQIERDRLNNGGQEAKLSITDILKWISRCKSRLGDLYNLSESYTDAVNTYRQVIQQEQKKIGHESNRGLAEIHYMIANAFLYDNKEGCEKVAIEEFIQAVQILVNNITNLNTHSGVIYDVPTRQKVKVDRFAYLPGPTDCQQSKQIKEVITLLLDKIEDTHQQAAIRSQYEAEKKKNKQEQQQSQFKQVSPTTNVIKLGTFGNRKKGPQCILPDQLLKKKE